jgi:hypothetical protein
MANFDCRTDRASEFALRTGLGWFHQIRRLWRAATFFEALSPPNLIPRSGPSGYTGRVKQMGIALLLTAVDARFPAPERGDGADGRGKIVLRQTHARA